MAKITLGINNYFAVKRWPEPEEWVRIVAKDLGLSTAQFDLDLLDPNTLEPYRGMQAARIRQACEKYGVRVQSTLTGGVGYHMSLLLHPDPGMRVCALDWFQKAVTLSAELKADGTGGPLGALSMKDFADAKRRAHLENCLKDALHSLGAYAKLHGQKYLIWEPSPVRRELPATISDAERLYEFVNDGAPLPVVYLFDVGHVCNFEGSAQDKDPYLWIKRIAKWCPIIHLQQTDGTGDQHWPFTREFNKVGIIDAKKVLEAIDGAGIKEIYLELEIIHAFEANESKVLDDLKETVEYWQKALLR